jgi:hypothetical protein
MYTLTSIQEYTEVIEEKKEKKNLWILFFLKLLEKCGFIRVHAEDCSELYQQYCLNEIEIAEKNRSNPSSVNITYKIHCFSLCIYLVIEINSSRSRWMC